MSDWASDNAAKEEAYTVSAKVNYKGMNSGKVKLRCPWADRYTIAADIINNNRLFPTGSIGAIAAEISIDPAPQSAAVNVTAGGVIEYDEALLTIDYNVAEVANLEKVPTGANAGILYSEALEPNIEYLKLDKLNFTWTDASGRPVTEAESPSRPSRGFNLVRTYYNIPSIDSSYLDLGDTCNDAAYTSVPLGLTFDIGTLRFIPAPLNRTILTSGSKGWNLTLKWAYRKATWNKFWRVDKSGSDKYDTIYDKVNAAAWVPCPLADHTPWLYG